MAAEVRAAEPNALSVLQGSGGSIGPTGSSTINPVTLTTDHPRVTLLSMVAPSPDWFVGVFGLPLLDAQGDWLSSRALNLYPWDTGTEEGTEFWLSNPATSPQGVITGLRGLGKFSNEPIATLTFTRQSVNTAPSFTSDTSFEVDENQTTVATVVAADPDSGDGVSYAITGGADASKFDIVETTGVLTFKTPPNYESAADVASTDPLNDAGNNEYIVTVTATGGTDDRAMMTEQTITVTVRNLEEAGTVSFSQVGAAIRATLSDPDSGVTSATWQWARSSDRSTGWVSPCWKRKRSLWRSTGRMAASLKRCSPVPTRPILWGWCAARPRESLPEWPWSWMPARESSPHCRWCPSNNDWLGTAHLSIAVDLDDLHDGRDPRWSPTRLDLDGGSDQ